MSVADKVLELLENANHPFSGEEMAQQLGITRNSVWKAVGKLKEQGYEIEAATNRGYRLVSEKNVLTPQGVRRLLTGPARRCAIDVQDSVTSTNTLLKQIAEHGGAEGMVLIAHQQTQGKGRLGRAFFSPKGTGLYLSVLLRPRFSAEEALSITTAAAVAAAQAIDAVTGEHAQIKWVNDVYLRGRKVCGILTEAARILSPAGCNTPFWVWASMSGSRRGASPLSCGISPGLCTGTRCLPGPAPGWPRRS